MYKIAGFNFELKDFSGYKDYFTSFEATEESPDFIFSVTEEDILAERDKNVNFPWEYLRYIAFHRKIAEAIPQRDAFVLHSAAFSVNGQGIAFAAHSGTGKTTHLNRWKAYLGEKMTVINGDKPIVRYLPHKENTPYVFGTPWNGKENLGCNTSAPLKHICFIERADTNYVEKAEKSAVLERIFNQVYMPRSPLCAVKTMSLINRMLGDCELWIIHCNMDENAGETAYKGIFKEAAE